jgi:hypothetical protein
MAVTDADTRVLARDKLWPAPCDPSLWGDMDQFTACQAVINLACNRIPENPVMRHSILLVTCIDLEYLYGQDYTALKLRHMNAAMQQVRRGIAAYETDKAYSTCRAYSSSLVASHPSDLVTREEMLFAMMALAKQSHSTSITPCSKVYGLFHPPFPLGLQFLNIWGQQAGNQLHCRAMQYFTASKAEYAALAGVCTPGFAEVVAQFDLFESAKCLASPFLRTSMNRLHSIRQDFGYSQRASALQGRFEVVFARPSTYATLLDILSDIRLYCILCSEVLEHSGADVMPSGVPRLTWIGKLSVLRDLVERRLLSYQFADGSIDERLCWTVSAIFVHCVIYPLPTRKPLDILLSRLLTLLDEFDTEFQGETLRALVAWASVIGAMACDDSGEAMRRLFLERLRGCIDRTGMSSLAQIKPILQGFLWLDQACEVGVIQIWGMLEELEPVRTAVSLS